MIDNDFEVSDLEIKVFASHKVLAEAFVEHYIDFQCRSRVNTMGTKGKGVVSELTLLSNLNTDVDYFLILHVLQNEPI